MIISFESVILKHNKIITPEKRLFMKKTKLIFSFTSIFIAIISRPVFGLEVDNNSLLRNIYSTIVYEYSDTVIDFKTSHNLVTKKLDVRDARDFFINSEMDEYAANDFKAGDRIAVFSVPFDWNYLSKGKVTAYTYGGITPYQKLQYLKISLVIYGINRKQIPVPYNQISPTKTTVTAQEIDLKARKFLISQHQLYSSGSNYKSGKLVVHTNDNSDKYSLDLFYVGYRDKESIFKVYKDNKSFNIDKIGHLDIEIDS
uniref:SPEX-2 protein n=1 Tax=Streptococcus pyogenes TaxID=1314 RepID=Q9X9R8_STRPY|nr:SPEX-2 protein [Streptococcus pyogenes]